MKLIDFLNIFDKHKDLRVFNQSGKLLAYYTQGRDSIPNDLSDYEVENITVKIIIKEEDMMKYHDAVTDVTIII